MQRDNIGIGGPWSEFLEYLITSINSRDTKIVFEGQSTADGDFSCTFISLINPRSFQLLLSHESLNIPKPVLGMMVIIITIFILGVLYCYVLVAPIRSSEEVVLLASGYGFYMET